VSSGVVSLVAPVVHDDWWLSSMKREDRGGKFLSLSGGFIFMLRHSQQTAEFVSFLNA
jgi:hypothetical protein